MEPSTTLDADTKTKFAFVEVFKQSDQLPILQTETRIGTVQGCGGHYQCRRVPVTLPYSGTMQ